MKFLDFIEHNLGKICILFFVILAADVSIAIWWNNTHNQIINDCENVIYYAQNHVKCASWRLHNGYVVGPLIGIGIASGFAGLIAGIIKGIQVACEREGEIW